jgi:hypothetical protein
VLDRSGRAAPQPLNVNARGTENIEVSLGGGADIVQLTSGTYNHDIRVNAGAGNDTFNVENGVDMVSNLAEFFGGEGDDLLFVDYSKATIIDHGSLFETVTHVLSSFDGERVEVPGNSTALQPGTYFIEMRREPVTDEWQFRMVDSAGLPVALAAAGETDAIVLGQLLLGATSVETANEAIAAARIGNAVDAFEFNVIYDEETITVSVTAASFATTEELRVHIETAVDTALIDAGLNAGDLVTRVGSSNAIVLGLPVLDADSVAIAESIIAAGRDGSNLPQGLTFDLIYNDQSYAVTVTAGTFADADALLAHIVNAVGSVLAGVTVESGARLTGDWQDIADVPLVDGERVLDTLRGFVITFGNNIASYAEGSVSTGNAAEVLAGAPTSQLALEYHGGAHTPGGKGDTFRIAGDGVVTGGEYRPSSTEMHAGTMTLGGNTFTFTGVEPLVIHGLPDFEVVTPTQDAALLNLESVAVSDLDLSSLVLQVVTVDGVVSWTQQHKFKIVDALEPENVGKAMAVSEFTDTDGKTVTILAVAADLVGASYGTVYIYEWQDAVGLEAAGWKETAKLYPGDYTPGNSSTLGQGFGASLALSGNTLVVGAPDDDGFVTNNGAVYVFERIDGAWQQVAKLYSPYPDSNDAFGSSVAFDGTTIVVAEFHTAYVFQRSGDGWVDTNTLKPFYEITAVGVAGDYIALGRASAFDSTYTNSIRSGEVRVYGPSGNYSALHPGDPVWDEGFGSSLAMTATQIVVGSPGWDGVDGNTTDQGRAFVFELIDGKWERIARLTADGGLPAYETGGEGRAGDNFGASVAINGIYAAVGAPNYDGDAENQGAAYVFYKLSDLGSGNGPTWLRSSGSSGSGRLEAANPAGTDPDALRADNFGASVALSNDRLMVGMPGYNDVKSSQHNTSQNSAVIQPDDWVEITTEIGGGLEGETYQYLGAVSRTGFTGVDFTDEALWEKLPTNHRAPDYTTADANVSVTAGQWVELVSNIGNGTQGDVYVYRGDTPLTSFVGVNFADTSTWRRIENVPVQVIVRGDVGSFRTFETSGEVPEETASILPAEILKDGTTTSLFGSETLYDPASRTLFVAAPDAGANNWGTVTVYINEDLYWRKVQTIHSPYQPADFGTSMALKGNTLVVGATSDAGNGFITIYTRSGETWIQSQIITGNHNSFGTSVDISGDSIGSRIVVGEPGGNPGYRTSGGDRYVNLHTPGNAIVYKRYYADGPGGRQDWYLERRLMPTDGNLPTSGTKTTAVAIPGAATGLVWHDIYSGTVYSMTKGHHNGSHSTSYSSAQIGPATQAYFYDTDWIGDDGYVRVINYTTNYYYRIKFVESRYNITLPSGIEVWVEKNGSLSKYYAGDTLPNLRWINDDIDSTYMGTWDLFGAGSGKMWATTNVGVGNGGSSAGITNQSGFDGTNYYGVSGEQWGSSVAFVGNNTVIVGAPSGGGIAAYNLSTYSNSGFTLNKPGRALLPYYRDTSPSTLGSELIALDSDRFLASAEYGSGEAAWVYQRYSSTYWWPVQQVQQLTDNTYRFGAGDAITTRGALTIIGAPGSSAAYVYNSDYPYLYDDLKLTAFDMSSTTFGAGPAIISEGFYLVGTESSESLFNFRRRGPEWTPITTNDLELPDALPTAKLGASIAIDGNTAVSGAPDYDDRGAAFVFSNTPGSDLWVAEALLRPTGLDLGDQFGAAVAISGDTLVVGAPNAKGGDGAVYVFQRVGQVWNQVAELAGDGADGFGTTLDIDVSTIVVGSSTENAAYVFRLVDETWTKTNLGDLPGIAKAVAVDGDSIVIGMPAGVGQTFGQALVYGFDGTNWVQQGTFLTSGAETFGSAVDISGDNLIVGAHGEESGKGAAYIYERITPDMAPSYWSLVDRLSIAVGRADDFFGFSVGIDNESAVVGAYGRDRNPLLTDDNEGEAYTFGLKGGEWKLETVVESLFGSDAEPGDMTGYAVAISGGTAITGAPQLNGRPGLLIDTQGADYAYIRSVSAPVNVTVPELQEELIEGAQANILSGSVGIYDSAYLTFFDIGSVTIQTGDKNDELNIAETGLTAFGLSNFEVNTGAGDDTLTTLSTELQPPAAGTYVRNTGDSDGTNLYTQMVGSFTYNGESGAGDRLVATADTDWRLGSATLIGGTGQQLNVLNVDNASLTGGASGNVLEVAGWTGTVTLDGAGESDQIRVAIGSLTEATVTAQDGSSDQLTVLGTSAGDNFTVGSNVVIAGSSNVYYSGIAILRIAGLEGDDTLSVLDSSADEVFLDGNMGSDTYEIFAGLTDPLVRISDSGPPLSVLPSGLSDYDTLKLPIDAQAGAQPNTEFPVDGKTAIFDETIEELEVSEITPILVVPGTGGSDNIRLYVLNGSAYLEINGVSTLIDPVVDLTIDLGGGDDTIVIEGVLPTLTNISINGGGNNDTISTAITPAG